MLVVAYVAYGAAMLSLIVLRWKKPDTAEWKRPFKVERTISSYTFFRNIIFRGCSKSLLVRKAIY